MGKRIAWLTVLAIGITSGVASALPRPKEGLLIPRDQVDEVRKKIARLMDSGRLKRIVDRAENALAQWPADKQVIEPQVGKALDILWQGNPKEFVPPETNEAIKKLNRMLLNAPSMALQYLLTDDRRYAQACYEIIEMCGRVPRWGWFNWDGANMPQIHYGFLTRNAAFALDWCWDGWDEMQREKAVGILARRGVECYWRLVSLTPFMGLHHLRCKNQGNNALGGAIIGSLAVGDSVPENKVWLDSLLHTYAWIVAHDIGWAGQGLESGLGGYWTVSMQNLYTAAAALYNARGIDLRVHPGIAEATWYPVFHEATVPRGLSPYEKNEVGASAIIGGKPIEIPGGAIGGPWWRDFARKFPESPAGYFVSKAGDHMKGGHQAGHSQIIQLLWAELDGHREAVRKPGELFKSTDRMTMFRSGYGSPHTYLYFNGDFFLSARNEILRATSGMSWHWPWHQYAVAESVLETEGEPLSPSMLVRGMFNNDFVSMTHNVSGPSNVTYYRKAGQNDSYQAYKVRDRDIAYVRSPDRDKVYDYFLFIDRVAQEGNRWHGVNWHLWNSPKSPGRYEILGDNTAIGCRPNADILLATLSHEKVAYEQEGISSQPKVAYQDDHHALLLRAVLGGYGPTREQAVVLPAALWSEGTMGTVDGLKTMHMKDFKEKTPTLRTPVQMTPGARYRLSMETRKQRASVYENTAWVISFKLLDKAGSVVAEAAAKHRLPHALRLSDPGSLAASYDWRTTVTHFDAPENVAFIEARFVAAQYSHPPYGLKPDSEVWLSEITLTCLGKPHRTGKDVAVTLAMPLPKEAKLPPLKVTRRGRLRAEITHPDGTVDTLTFDAEGRPTIARKRGNVQRTFAWDASHLRVGDTAVEATAPLRGAFTTKGGALRGKVTLISDARVNLGGKTYELPPGSHLYDGQFRRDTAEASLVANSAENQEALRRGLAAWTRLHREARDKYTSRGWKNIALEAMAVTASASRDRRFAAGHVIDNRVCEFPAEGLLDYTQGPIETTQSYGYARMEHMSYFGGFEGRSAWPFYVRPTYWLLPPRTLGEVTIKLKRPTKIKMVRVLNTSNGGLNDFAAMDFHVDLLIPSGLPQWTTKRSFGRAWDRAFEDAFAMPDYFKAYGSAFEGMLEPGVKVPFGAGWADVKVDYPKPVAYVRVTVDKVWAMGGGINEIQVYAAEEPAQP